MPQSTYPDYINPGHPGFGIPVLRMPGMQRDGEFALFVLKADLAALNALCDKFLNEPIRDGSTRYEPLGPFVFFVYANMEISSLYPVDRDMGWSAETDACFWVFTKVLSLVEGSYKFERLAWFMPYLFIGGNQYGVDTGREVYGFRKLDGTFEGPTDITDPEFSVNTLAFKRFDANTQGRTQPVLTVREAHGESSLDDADAYATFVEALEDILGILVAEDEDQVVQETVEILRLFIDLERDDRADAAQEFQKIVNDFLDQGLLDQTNVFLKQFRDVADTNKAVYQAIVEAEARFTVFRGGGAIPRVFELILYDLESHPIAQMLGLRQDGPNFMVGGWFKGDFVLETGREVYRVEPAPPQKIAILGGGMGALATAFALTSEPGWQQRYELTVYQMGWRLGGKAASGRNQAVADRIEEHGVHIWYGFYDNAFRLVQELYQALDRPKHAPFATWDAAFERQSLIVLEEFHNDQWKHWPIYFPENRNIPGEDVAALSAWGYFKISLTAIFDNLTLLPLLRTIPLARESLSYSFLKLVGAVIEQSGANLVDGLGGRILLKSLAQVRSLAESLDEDLLKQSGRLQKQLLHGLKLFLKLVWATGRDLAEDNDDLRRLVLILELATVNLIGMVEDGVIRHGFGVINDLDYRAWLRRHGASETVVMSAPVRAIYDVTFAYPQGDTGSHTPSDRGNMAAGTALHLGLLIALTYKGAVIWKMKSSMGEVVIAPLYEVLKQRGVTFKFFHKVEQIIPAADGRTIAEIVINRQAELKAGNSYDPLLVVQGLPTWPNRPLYDQLKQGRELQKREIDLESPWSEWPGVGPALRLKQGQDFDLVVLGIPIAALPAICEPLLSPAGNPYTWQAWQNMISQVQTVPTQSVQLWFKPDLKGLGWGEPSPLLGSYENPLNTWADMSQTLAQENWPAPAAPQSIAYLAGPLKETTPLSPGPDPAFPATQQGRVEAAARHWLSRYSAHLWPDAVSGAAGFNFALLADMQNQVGPARLAAQYWRANISPSDRYVLSTAGSDRYRLKPAESGFKNLFLVGDWVDNGFLNLGSVETTVITALQTAKAISKLPHPIVGALRL
jgi:uncharacterized protein with NAD-binding domain and iron-sulfur cluster